MKQLSSISVFQASLRNSVTTKVVHITLKNGELRNNEMLTSYFLISEATGRSLLVTINRNLGRPHISRLHPALSYGLPHPVRITRLSRLSQPPSPRRLTIQLLGPYFSSFFMVHSHPSRVLLSLEPQLRFHTERLHCS